MYMVGWDKQEIEIQAQGYAMFGYGMWTHRAEEKRTALFARSFSICDQSNQRLIFCCIDFGCITHAIRSGAVAQLTKKLGLSFQENQFVLMATHTHSGPGGCGHEALYNMPTPGFVPEHLDAVIQAILISILNAIESEQDTEIRSSTGCFHDDIPVAWNRSIKAYNRNSDVQHRTDKETHLALNREMQLIGFYRQNQLQSLISLFGVHATCLGNTLKAHDGDNKGYAAMFVEQTLLQKGSHNPVAIFAQATAGDVSPHFHGEHQQEIRNKIKGEKEYQYAQKNGHYQSEIALTALTQKSFPVQGAVSAVLSYVDLTDVEIPPEFTQGLLGMRTSQPCHGVPFFAGTPVDGHGTPKLVTASMAMLSKMVRKKRMSNSTSADYAKYKALYDSQGVKNIVIEVGGKKLLGQSIDVVPGIFDPVIAEMNRQVKAGAIQDSPLVPQIMPLQIVRLGNITLICCPGEITTVAGQRLIQTVKAQLSAKDLVWLASYCNDYMGYITTFEEYQEQAYEGGHTLFGQWTHAAFQTEYQQLAQQLNLPKEQRNYDQSTRPPIIPIHELAKRTNHGSLKTAASKGEF
ncbi:neutral/alkaline non-lysosomal ceramidase N-terminal domain-containing protein [Acinetobacter sp. ANC 3832]|uniref:neutral/alkaline non-lysosomal ceramidase N-terminal domain-containing protein n=1 Tax=Acinetobacter sp. ANC 3832 TaxID=1977874 RepID=UPI000A35336B|nr:neutral/alkaline non-lysosomal ceramidase N-terminal domain-containing protein [Acinetobacter sp. ANC 3832]OTG96136.1 ceramidase [Acinetobacter sp. ANC 3832]